MELKRVSPPLEPRLDDYQLVGDSQMLRFTSQMLNKQIHKKGGMNFQGLCASGETIRQLLDRVSSNFYPVDSKIVVLIGTNDFLQNAPLETMCHTMTQLLQILMQTATSIIVLTVPPIPKLCNHPNHWETLEGFNRLIMQLPSKHGNP